MKKIHCTLFLLVFSFISYGQDMKIKWTDSDGREFSISCITAELSYSMLPGDKIEYVHSTYENAGKIRKIGPVLIEYIHSTYENAGKIKKIGPVLIEYVHSTYENAGKIKKVGGLTIEYVSSIYENAGKVESTRGSVN